MKANRDAITVESGIGVDETVRVLPFVVAQAGAERLGQAGPRRQLLLLRHHFGPLCYVNKILIEKKKKMKKKQKQKKNTSA